MVLGAPATVVEVFLMVVVLVLVVELELPELQVP